PLTATALSSAPVDHAGMASAVNNDVARAGGLIAVALLPPLAGLSGRSYLHPVAFTAGFRHALVIAAVAAALGGLIAAATVRNPRRAPGGRRAPHAPRTAAPPRLCCPLEATPLDGALPAPTASPAAGTGPP
ncbi:MAG TPA: hypothetical protein VLZ77_03710, partial [Acidimicrobiales bacterium]|nr:hypothetical protein [Acidimicrobiales bacterium]